MLNLYNNLEWSAKLLAETFPLGLFLNLLYPMLIICSRFFMVLYQISRGILFLDISPTYLAIYGFGILSLFVISPNVEMKN